MAKKLGLNHPQVISKIAEAVEDLLEDYSYTEEEYEENPIYKDWDEVGGEGYAPNTQSIVEESGSDEDEEAEELEEKEESSECSGCEHCGCGSEEKVVKVIEISQEDLESLKEGLRNEMEDGHEIIKDYMLSH